MKGQLKIGDLAQAENNDAAAWRAREAAQRTSEFRPDLRADDARGGRDA